MSRNGNIGMTNLNPYKTEYTYATEESRNPNVWEHWCFYRSNGGKCANTLCSFYKQRCMHSHSCHMWTKEMKANNIKSEDVDKAFYIPEDDYLNKILEFCLYDKRQLLDIEFRKYLQDNLFTKEDSTDSKDAFFVALDELAKMPLNSFPLVNCLIIEGETNKGIQTYFQGLDGNALGFRWETQVFEQINKYIRIVAYYCLRKNIGILKKFSTRTQRKKYFYESDSKREEYFFDEYIDSIEVMTKELKERNAFPEEIGCDFCVGDGFNFSDYDSNRYIYIWDRALVSDNRYHSKYGKKAKLYCAIVLPIKNTFSDVNDVNYNIAALKENIFRDSSLDFQSYDINKVLRGKYIKNQLMGEGKILNYSFDKKIKVEFLDFPHRIFEYEYPNSFKNGENIFIEEEQYIQLKDEIEKYYQKKLVGLRVVYCRRDLDYDTFEWIKTEYNGVIVGYEANRIRVSNIDEDGYYSKYSYDVTFEYPIRKDRNYYELEILY